LYGTTLDSIFSINTDGSNLRLLHAGLGSLGTDFSFTSSLTAAGTTLYGTTANGGANHAGSVFSIGLDGSNYQVLHSFGAAGDGATPEGGLALVGSVLVGTTEFGGDSDHGTVFTMQITIVPEPSGVIMAAFGFTSLTVLGGRRRCRVRTFA
jgi:uncharacterized repeat protein (TIGR03803 family)